MSRLRLPPKSPRKVRVRIDASRLTFTARATMLATSIVTPASRTPSDQLREPARTVTGRSRRAISTRCSFSRAAASCRPPTGTPPTLTPCAIRSRREWSYRYTPAARITARATAISAASQPNPKRAAAPRTRAAALRAVTDDAFTYASGFQWPRSDALSPRRPGTSLEAIVIRAATVQGPLRALQAGDQRRTRGHEDRERERGERAVERREQALARQRFGAAVAAHARSTDRLRAAAQLAGRRAQPPLSGAHREAPERDQDPRQPDLLGVCEIAGERRKGAPAERKPCVTVKAPASQLEVVRRQEQRPGNHQGQ